MEVDRIVTVGMFQRSAFEGKGSWRHIYGDCELMGSLDPSLEQVFGHPHCHEVFSYV